MARPTNVTKYTIDGVEIPIYPEKIVPSDNLVSRSWNNMYAQFIDIPVNLKYKVNWVFPVVSKEEMIQLVGPLRNKILTQGSRFFTITTAYPGFNTFLEMDVYLGTPTNFQSLDWMGIPGYKGGVNYYNLELHWIETKGQLLIGGASNGGNSN